MKNIVSYRQKLFALAKIYQINKVLDTNLKFTTYEIELELLRNKVPIPSRRGYFSHKVINEFFKPFYNTVKENLETNINLKKIINSSTNFLKENLEINTKLRKIINSSNNFLKENLKININLTKITKRIDDGVNNYFVFVISSVANFFKTLVKLLVQSLNNAYNFKVNEKIVNKFIVRGVYTSIFAVLFMGGFYIKGQVSNLDSVKISLEIKSDKKEAKNLNKIKKQDSENVVKKLEKKTKPFESEADYSLNTQTVLNLFEDLDYDLDNVRESKLVKPIYFTRLPKDIDKIRSTKKRKLS